MSLTSDEVNYLVFRYLVESGFIHTSFAFQQESAIHKSDIKGSSVKPGALINVIQKGLQYMEIEAHLREDGTEKKCNAPFSLTGKHECELADEDDELRSNTITAATTTTSRKNTKKTKEKSSKRTRKESGMSDIQLKDDPMLDIETENNSSNGTTINHQFNGIEHKSEPNDMNNTNTNSNSTTSTTASSTTNNSTINDNINTTATSSFYEDTLYLEGHQSAVVCGVCHPVNSFIFASGSTDCTTRIWNIPSSSNQEATCKIIRPADEEIASEVTCLTWNQSGKLLAVGDRAGHLRIWSENGELLHIMKKHENAILSLSWNKRGDVLVSTSEDCSAIAWDSTTGESRQQFEYHTEAIVGVSWQDNITFATASHDRDVFVCQLGSPVPIKQCEGHQDKVTCLAWDSKGEHLLTGSDDCDLRLWKLDVSESCFTFKGHKAGVTNLTWAPEGAEDTRIFASSSADGTIRVWELDNYTPLYVLDTPSFSMKKQFQYLDVRFLYDDSFVVAGATNQGVVHVANRKSKQIIKSIKASVSDVAKVLSLSVNKEGNRLYGSISDKNVLVAFLNK